MRRIVAAAAAVLVLAAFVAAQERVGTTTGGPLTVAGVPVYAIVDNGDLQWYFHQGAFNGSASWAGRGQGVKVGNGWNEGLRVFKGSPRGAEGIVYRVDSRGDLYWYRHNGHHTGSSSWAETKKVGSGWQGARLAFAAGDGVIYMINREGDLLWYRHLGYLNGSAQWANGGNISKVGNGWGGMRLAFSGGKGVIYAIDGKGDLYWYRHTGYTNGSFNWSNGASGVKVGSGWNDAASAFSGGDGLIYVLKRDGNLYWYNNTGFATGAATWSSPTGNRIGTGWGGFVRIF